MPPFSVLQIDHVVLRIADLERSLAFYTSVLGCRIERRNEALGLVHLRAGSSQIDLVPFDAPRGRVGGGAPMAGAHNVDHFALQIAPFDEAALRAHLAAHEVTIVDSARRFGAQGFGPSLYIKDPDGNTVELKGPPDGL